MRTRTIFASAAAALLLPLFGAMPAGANQTAESAPPAVTAAPPGCVNVYVDNSTDALYDWANVFNDCPARQRVKVVVAWAPDSHCIILNSGSSYRFVWASIGRFDGLQAC